VKEDIVNTNRSPKKDGDGVIDPGALSVGEGTEENSAAWARLENGRYQPRRIRGSCHGRELG
jgi:hypothetical protein